MAYSTYEASKTTTNTTSWVFHPIAKLHEIGEGWEEEKAMPHLETLTQLVTTIRWWVVQRGGWGTDDLYLHSTARGPP